MKFKPLFFLQKRPPELLYSSLCTKEQLIKHTKRLESLYQKKIFSYKNFSDFSPCKNQLLHLLKTYKKSFPELGIQEYIQHVQQLSKKSSYSEIDITLRNIKELLEYYFPIIENQPQHISEAFNNAFSNSSLETYFKLSKALNLTQEDYFSYLIENTKKDILFTLACDYLKQIHIKIHSPDINNIAFLLFLSVSEKYGIDMPNHIEDINLPTFMLNHFDEYTHIHFTERNFLKVLEKKLPQVSSQRINMDKDSTLANQENFRHFLDCLGQEEFSQDEYSKLYSVEYLTSKSAYVANSLEITPEQKSEEPNERLEQNPDLHFYRPKNALKERKLCLIAENLAKKGYMGRVYYKINQDRLVYNGKQIFLLDKKEGYLSLTQNYTIHLLQEIRPSDDKLKSLLFKHLSAENLYRIYCKEIKLLHLQQENDSFNELLERASLPKSIIEGLCEELIKETNNHTERKAFLDYLLKYNVEPLPKNISQLTNSVGHFTDLQPFRQINAAPINHFINRFFSYYKEKGKSYYSELQVESRDSFDYFTKTIFVDTSKKTINFFLLSMKFFLLFFFAGISYSLKPEFSSIEENSLENTANDSKDKNSQDRNSDTKLEDAFQEIDENFQNISPVISEDSDNNSDNNSGNSAGVNSQIMDNDASNVSSLIVPNQEEQNNEPSNVNNATSIDTDEHLKSGLSSLTTAGFFSPEQKREQTTENTPLVTTMAGETITSGITNPDEVNIELNQADAESISDENLTQKMQ